MANRDDYSRSDRTGKPPAYSSVLPAPELPGFDRREIMLSAGAVAFIRMTALDDRVFCALIDRCGRQNLAVFTADELADECGAHPRSVRASLRRMEAKGVVIVTTDPRGSCASLACPPELHEAAVRYLREWGERHGRGGEAAR